MGIHIPMFFNHSLQKKSMHTYFVTLEQSTNDFHVKPVLNHLPPFKPVNYRGADTGRDF